MVNATVHLVLKQVALNSHSSQKDAFQQGDITSTCVSIPKPQKPPNGDLREIIMFQDSITYHTILDIERISKKWLDFKNSRSKNTFSEKKVFSILREISPLYLPSNKCTMAMSLDVWIF